MRCLFMARLLVLLLLVLVYPSLLSAQEDGSAAVAVVETPQIEWKLPTGPQEVGRIIDVELNVLMSGDYSEATIRFPKGEDTRLLIVGMERVTPQSFKARIRPLRAGAMDFKPVVTVKPEGAEGALELVTPSFFLEVTEPVVEPSKELKDLTEPLLLPFSYFWRNVILVTAGVLVLALLMALAFLIGRYLKKRAEYIPPVPVIPPVVTALEQVKYLRRMEVFNESGADAHYTQLSLTMRQYIEKQFGYSAVEMTDDEVVALINREMKLIGDADLLPQVLQRSSMAKFARQELTAGVAEGDCDACERFLRREKARIAAAEAAAEASRGSAKESNGEVSAAR